MHKNNSNRKYEAKYRGRLQNLLNRPKDYPSNTFTLFKLETDLINQIFKLKPVLTYKEISFTRKNRARIRIEICEQILAEIELIQLLDK